MIDFIIRALPFVIMGICIAIICLNGKRNKQNHIIEGMLGGMCVGLLSANIFNLNIGLLESLGMLIGEAIGSFIKKENK